jgi:hypothetical protein
MGNRLMGQQLGMSRLMGHRRFGLGLGQLVGQQLMGQLMGGVGLG